VKSPDDIVTPESFIRYLRTALKLRPSEIRLPRRGVVVFGGEDFETFRRAIRGRRASWSQWQCVGHSGRQRAFVGRSTIGAPAAAIVVEEMGVRGVRDFIAFGACGSLRSDLPIGTTIVPTFAHSDEGTSRYYDGPRRPSPNPKMLRAIKTACDDNGLSFVEGGVWTSDAPYRESRRVARALARQGVVAVDMEASALYTLARHRGYRIASLMVVSDELGGDGWNPGFRDPRFLRAKKKAIRAVVDALGRRWP
jgi:uridine phosphorylase